MVKLGVNIDHVATIREARKGSEPSPVDAARECLAAGADSIVAHLREDRRHIQDADMRALRKAAGRFNLEMSIAKEIVDIACRIRPDQAKLVPERRMEVTTEGGLDVKKNEPAIGRVVARLQARGIAVSLFINPFKEQIDAAVRTGATIIEFHTGEYANAAGAAARRRQLAVLQKAAAYALSKGLEVNAGHGLDYGNVTAVARIPGMHELNIGHSIVSRAVFVGMRQAVRQMKDLL